MGQSSPPFSFSGTGVTGSNADTSTFALGTQSIFVTTNGAGGQGKISGNFGSALNLTGQCLVVWFRQDNLANTLGGYPRLYVGDAALTNAYFWKLTSSAGQPWNLDGEWIRVTLPFGTATTVGAPSRASLATLTIQIFDNSTGTVTLHLGAIATMNESTAFSGGVVSLCFDDGFGAQSSIAAPYMDKYGFRGTAYIICETLFNNTAYPGYMNTGQVRNLEAFNGWEIASHAYTAANHNAGYTGIPDSSALGDMEAAKAYLTTQGFKAPDHFSYPLGVYNSTTIANVKTVFSTGRTISQVGGFPDETFPPAQFSRLRGFAVSETSGIVNPTTYVTQAAANKEWLILVFHNILNSGAAGSIQLSTAHFQTLMDSINTAGIPVMPVGEVLKSGYTT
jgi:hypothetical protein